MTMFRDAARGAAAIPRAAALGLGLLAGGWTALAADEARAKPDLVVNVADSTVTFGGCEQNEPLATGRIAIRNDGESRASMRLGVVTRFTRSMLAVYEPEHPDMVDYGKERTALDPKDQESVPFSVGERVVKKGRFASVDAAPAMLDTEALSADDKKLLQQALKDLKHYGGSIDGVLGRGYRAAVSAFQTELGEEATGALTAAQTAELSRKSGRKLAGADAGSGVRVPVTIYAVVDPFNLVEESDEANNIAKFSGEIFCD